MAGNGSGITLTGLDMPAEQLFDLAPLREVYRDNPGLGA
jgi:hypothetical protein